METYEKIIKCTIPTVLGGIGITSAIALWRWVDFDTSRRLNSTEETLEKKYESYVKSMRWVGAVSIMGLTVVSTDCIMAGIHKLKEINSRGGNACVF